MPAVNSLIPLQKAGVMDLSALGLPERATNGRKTGSPEVYLGRVQSLHNRRLSHMHPILWWSSFDQAPKVRAVWADRVPESFPAPMHSLSRLWKVFRAMQTRSIRCGI